MARSLNDIYSSIIAEKDRFDNLVTLLPNANVNNPQPVIDSLQTLLTDLTTTSRVAIWRLWAYVIAFAIWVHENLWDLFKAEVENIIAKFRPGTLRWYQEQAFNFQYGDLLAWDAVERKYKYAVIDTTKNIVKRCSVTEPAGVVRIKVAKEDGHLVALTNTELQALQAYFNRIKYPGRLVCVSFNADSLIVAGVVKHDPLIDPGNIQPDVEAAINGYLKGLEFDGRFIINKLIDRVQAVPGVVDFTDTIVLSRYGLVPYSNVDDEYQTNAGYAEIDTGYPLSFTITYVPYV